MSEIVGHEETCDCGAKMRRVFTTVGMVFKGTGWPTQAYKRQGEDEKIREARKSAIKLKESGTVPWKEQIKIKEAVPMENRLASEIRKKEIEKARSGQLDREMDSKLTT